jgi:hypothetical protein
LEFALLSRAEEDADAGLDAVAALAVPEPPVSPAQDRAARRAERKRRKREQKARARANREGRGAPTVGQKLCDECGRGSDLLVRCQHDATRRWAMVCGRCWTRVSGGVRDGDEAHPFYRYGGLWKNRHVRMAAPAEATSRSPGWEASAGEATGAGADG